MPDVIVQKTKKASAGALLDRLRVGEKVRAAKLIVIKPNLIENRLPPVTTPVDIVAEVARYLRGHTQARVVVAEGSGLSVRLRSGTGSARDSVSF